ncbi:MAG: hypothetical protein IPN77_24645 [Sandaracinaceae bacterium]|nr:hypothetical protein [Sandaracinaceae bacterium]
MTRRASDLLLTRLFLVALTAWAFNDHVLRRIAPGVLSGKLGDAASMVVFPILVAATFAPLARRLRVDERHLVDAAALGTALLLAAIQFHQGVAHAYQWALGTVQYAVGWSSYPVLAAHTMDPTDALVTPLAILPALAMRGVRLAELVRRRSLPLAGAMTLVAVSGCGGQAWAGHADLRLHAGATENVQFDRDGQRVGEHRAGVAGASADVQLRVRKRAVLGGIAATASGWVPHIEEDYARYGAYSERYQALSLAPTVTLLGDNVVIRAGVGLTLATGRGQQVDAFRAFPFGFVRIEPGRPRRVVHPVIQLGSTDGFLWDARILAGGASFSFTRGYVALGVAGGARIGPALHGTRVQAWTFATWGGTLVDLYAWLELQVRVAPRASLLVSAQGGFQLPVVSLGLRWDLDLAGSLATGAIRPEVTLPSGR